MKNFSDSSDASLYYHEGTALDIASLDSSAAWGNLADAMKNATVIIPTNFFFKPMVMLPSHVEDFQIHAMPEAPGKGHEKKP